ncbi:MAG TPA: 4-(cytidine 5'-diphospho)-2-C-methyl-D-erythritol kinase, partial [Rhodospirillaceae bacterium]|nr:4-(cytidine 5'-diphospho)-2-C-methyl-D-erythritol kinase [Rhodospirillaceae bacterium]
CAVSGLSNIFSREPAFTLVLEKNIPVAAGLGGGSADAAAAIRLVCREWGVPHTGLDVRVLAERLGADVPMCLYGVPAWVAGVGERLTPLPQMPALDVLLVNPLQRLRTADVFAEFTATDCLDGGIENLPSFVASAAALSFLQGRQNHLTDVAGKLCPAIKKILDTLEQQNGCCLARMTGSGPTCFAIFEDEGACTRAARAIAAQYAGWWVQRTKTNQSTEWDPN